MYKAKNIVEKLRWKILRLCFLWIYSCFYWWWTFSCLKLFLWKLMVLNLITREVLLKIIYQIKTFIWILNCCFWICCFLRFGFILKLFLIYNDSAHSQTGRFAFVNYGWFWSGDKWARRTLVLQWHRRFVAGEYVT